MDILGLVDIPLWSLLLLVCLVSLYIYGSQPMSMWEKLGVPGPKSLPFIGNTHQLFDSTTGIRGGIDKMKDKYGKIFGIQYFRTPHLVVLDLEALKEVFVKDFTTYSDRHYMGGGLIQECVLGGLFFQNGMDWRRHRRIISPTFTSGKLKLITHYVNVTARQLSDKLEEHATKGTQPRAKTVFGAFSLDVIAGTAFGLNLDTQNNLEGPFFQNVSKLFQVKGSIKFVLALASIFPITGYLLCKMNISILDDDGIKFCKNQITQLVLDRKTDPDHFEHADFLQLLLKAEMDANDDDVAGEKKLTNDEVISSGILFIMAGFETTSNAMQFMAYSLAKNHDVQDKLVEEIREIVGDQVEVSYEMCQNLKYMEAVINESLRMYPPISSMNRKSLKDTTLKGVPVPAGVVMYIHIFNIGRDPEIYEDPNTFNPDRFLHGGKKLSSASSVGFLPFGFGPRQCIGMRLAMVEMKIALVNILRKVVIVDATPNVLELEDLTGMLSSRIPIQLELTKRY